MTKTEHYQLNQWEPEDQVRRTDFNEDNAKIDAAIKAVDQKADGKADISALAALQTVVAGKADRSECLRAITGSYTGTGIKTTIRLSLNVTPKLVIVAGGTYHGIFLYGNSRGSILGSSYVYSVSAEWTQDGLAWSGGSANIEITLNTADQVYQYLVLY